MTNAAVVIASYVLDGAIIVAIVALGIFARVYRRIPDRSYLNERGEWDGLRSNERDALEKAMLWHPSNDGPKYDEVFNECLRMMKSGPPGNSPTGS